MDKLMTVTEVADTLRVSAQTVRSLIKRDELPGVRVGNLYRIPKAAVARLVNAECDPELQVERDPESQIEDNRVGLAAADVVFGWIDDLKAEYPSVDIESVREIYGTLLSSDETVLARSAVEDVFKGLKD